MQQIAGSRAVIERLAALLLVAVTDKEPRSDILAVECHQQVACLPGHPAPAGIRSIPARCTRRVASSMKSST
jgi:hypothetical protein